MNLFDVVPSLTNAKLFKRDRYTCAYCGDVRPPFAVETLLRIHFLQQWFNLSDPAMEEALYDTPMFRECAGLDMGEDNVPDESTILRFRHLLEKHNQARGALMNGLFLAIDSTGQPSRWLSWQEAVTHEVLGKVAYGFGDHEFTFTGGNNRDTELCSTVTLKSILVMTGRSKSSGYRSSIPLSNQALFRRDRFTCAYCGTVHSRGLTRDHIVPLSRGGKDAWLNVCACCSGLSTSGCSPVTGEKKPRQSLKLSRHNLNAIIALCTFLRLFT